MSDNTILFRQANSPLKFDVIATEDGEVLSFKNAVLVRAETNMNRDEITEEGIAELSASIVGRPIDVEHDTSKNCGVFSSARPVDGNRALSVDGFIWADRYPSEAQGVQSGSRALSVEASADNAVCSVCSTVFASADDYCEHLRRRDISGATRKLKGLHGKGGAVTTHPAGTNTRFEPTQITFVASHDEAKVRISTEAIMADTKDEEKKETPEEKKDENEATEALDAQACGIKAEAPVTESVPQGEGGSDDENVEQAGMKVMSESMAQMQSQLTEMKASVEKLETAIHELKASLKLDKRHSTLQAFMPAEEWEKQKDTIANMDEAAFNLLAASFQGKKPKLSVISGVRLPEPVAGSTKEPLTLTKS